MHIVSKRIITKQQQQRNKQTNKNKNKNEQNTKQTNFYTLLLICYFKYRPYVLILLIYKAVFLKSLSNLLPILYCFADIIIL